MAKFDEREGNSCHIHLACARTTAGPSSPATAQPGISPVIQKFLAGQLAALRELTLLFAPNINSYKRFAKGSFAPTAVGWGHDNRTCSLRVVGHGLALRFENRVPGGDVNPYLAAAALIAAGLHGRDQRAPARAGDHGQRLRADSPVPGDAGRGAELWTQ